MKSEYTGRTMVIGGVMYYEAFITEDVWSPCEGRLYRRREKWWTTVAPTVG